MSGSVHLLEIGNVGDGDGRKWPKHSLVRNDLYFQEKIAELWIKDLPGGPQPGVTYRLNRLPNGYAGFEKARSDSKHVDRCIYGHTNGQFRSLSEFYPHFKFLMDGKGPSGCECKLCAGGGSRSKTKTAKVTVPRESIAAKTVARQSAPAPVLKHQQSDSDLPRPVKRKFVDVENTPDIYDLMIEKLNADREADIDEPIEERMSPDWRTSNAMSKDLLRSWQSLPKYGPRSGEIVMFVRKISKDERLLWNEKESSFQRFNHVTQEWLECPMWEAGVVTQMPVEPIAEPDLIDDTQKKRAANESGYRIEPLSEIGAERKALTKQYMYVHLHLIRPLSLWSECMTGIERVKYHPSIMHALTVTSSFSLIGRYRFKGKWPNATVFCRGAYIGPELVMVGDPVFLTPHSSDSQDVVTDIMLVTAIRLRFVNLDLDEIGLITPPANAPYQTSLHISGKAFTLDPTKCFDGVGKVSVSPASDALPSGLSGYGQWYHVHDPEQKDVRLEVPFTRVLSRCQEASARKIWFRNTMSPSAESAECEGASALTSDVTNIISHGLEGTKGARKYSARRDPRILTDAGKTWFWADTRIEQLDLYEVNNKSVGIKDIERTKGQVTKMRTALKALDGKVSAIAQHRAAKKQKEEHAIAKAQSSYGMVAASAQLSRTMLEDDTDQNVDTEGPYDEQVQEVEDTEDAMDVGAPRKPTGMMVSLQTSTGAIELSSDSENSDEAETDMRATQMAFGMRTGGTRY
jgi:hypothetical protein